MTALTTFEFKHGIVKTPVQARSVAEVESVLRAALRLRPDAFSIEVVNFDGQLQPLSQVSLSALGAYTPHPHPMAPFLKQLCVAHCSVADLRKGLRVALLWS